MIKKFYITNHSSNIINKFLSLRFFNIIDVDSLIDYYKNTLKIRNADDLINLDIKNKIEATLKYKKLKYTVYCNSNLNKDVLINLINELNNINTKKTQITIHCLDDKYNPKMEPFYQFFDEVVFIPSFRKIHIIKCEKINLINFKKIKI